MPDRVGVRGSEFDLVLSKAKVKPGRVIVQFVNGGEDPHDLRLQRLDPATGAQTGAELGSRRRRRRARTRTSTCA